ncbi:MAG: glucose/mannose-6-phosphate isomerase [Thermoleophilaceae bacterium]|nr:glucose/mannose-6-phosphate isomerase [Thermoleophilaceae bacterium]
MTAAVLDRTTIEAADPGGMLGDVLAQPHQLGDALWRAQSAGIPREDRPGGLVVCGMGGSAIGGDLATAALGDRATRPITTVRGYALESWTGPDSLVLCASYSGDTEETLACFEAAGLLGCPRVVVTSGGRLAQLARQEDVPVIPVAGGLTASTAVGYIVVAALEVAAQCEAGPRLTSEIDVAAEHLEELVTAWGPESAEDSEAKALARALQGTIPVIAGAGLTTPLAQRWKAALNLVARTPAFAAELPDLDHHEIAGWAGADDVARFSAIFLDDSDTHPRVQARLALTRDLVAPHAASAHVIQTRGQNAVQRVLSLVLLGDLVAHYAAALRGLDPAQPGPVEELKAELGA